MSHLLDELDLSNAFFYPASEADVFPLIHFEYLVFIYVDFMYNMDFLKSDLNFACNSKEPDQYKVVSEARKYSLGDIMNMDDFDEAKEILKRVLSESEIDSMLDYSNAYKGKEDVHIYDLEKPSGKKSRLVYIHYEGLMAYLLLFRKGLIAPKVLCTTVTGHHPPLENVFPLLLKELKSIPEMWITWRGESELYKHRINQIRWDGSCDILDACVYAK
jgi:hypothetical protein